MVTDFAILDSVNNNPYAGMLKCLYAIKFKCNKELNVQQKQSAYKCLNIIADDVSNSKDVRSWCYNQLGLILSGMSNFIKLSKFINRKYN